MNARKLKLIAYVLCKHFQGYTLLKNAPGTPWTSVKMLRNHHFMESSTLDIHDTYNCLSADFSDSSKKEITRMLFCTRYAFFDKETNGLTYRKEVKYCEIGDTPTVCVDKDPVPWDVLQKRNLDHIDRPVARIKEDIIYTGFACIGMPMAIETIEKDKTFGEYITDYFYKQKRKADSARLQFQPGLFKTLRHNLGR